jgi:hypothetical protein
MKRGVNESLKNQLLVKLICKELHPLGFFRMIIRNKTSCQFEIALVLSCQFLSIFSKLKSINKILNITIHYGV